MRVLDRTRNRNRNRELVGALSYVLVVLLDGCLPSRAPSGGRQLSWRGPHTL